MMLLASSFFLLLCVSRFLFLSLVPSFLLTDAPCVVCPEAMLRRATTTTATGCVRCCCCCCCYGGRGRRLLLPHGDSDADSDADSGTDSGTDSESDEARAPVPPSMLARELGTAAPLAAGLTRSSFRNARRLARTIQSGVNVLFITGAGVSVASGIRTFRTGTDGLWNNFVYEVCGLLWLCSLPSPHC